MSKVLFIEKLSNISDGVPVERLTTTGWERHRNDTLSDVGQVEIKPFPLVATFVLGYLEV